MENMFQQEKANNSWIDQLPGAKVDFKYHVISYLLMSVVFWIGWLSYGGNIDQLNGFPWPFYPMLFGAVALFFHFLAVYVLPATTDETSE